MDDYLEKAKSYQKSKHFLSISIIVKEIAFFIVLIFSGGSEFIANLIQTMIGNFYIQLLLYVSVVGLLLNFIGLIRRSKKKGGLSEARMVSIKNEFPLGIN